MATAARARHGAQQPPPQQSEIIAPAGIHSERRAIFPAVASEPPVGAVDVQEYGGRNQREDEIPDEHDPITENLHGFTSEITADHHEQAGTGGVGRTELAIFLRGEQFDETQTNTDKLHRVNRHRQNADHVK